MTTQQFISKTFGVSSERDRHCSSVFTDRDGNVFSYGYHYPLLFTVDGQDFVNVRGYSNTTAKHINWARSAAPHAIPVELDRNDRLPLTIEVIRLRLNEQRDQIANEMRSKKRKDTQVYKGLFHDLMRVDRSVEAVTA